MNAKKNKHLIAHDNDWEKMPEELRHALLAACRGRFQRELLRGLSRWSCTDRGSYKNRYLESRDNMVERARSRLAPTHDCELQVVDIGTRYDELRLVVIRRGGEERWVL